MPTKITDLIQQPTVTVSDGEYLIPSTDPAGYVPTYKDNSDIVNGQYLYKVVGVGTATAGVYPEYHIVAVNNSADGKTYVNDTANPIAIQTAGKVTYMRGRNNGDWKDAYHGGGYAIVNNITAGEEARELLKAFLQYVTEEYSMGVNDYYIDSTYQ
jgi:hypothetical protein